MRNSILFRSFTSLPYKIESYEAKKKKKKKKNQKLLFRFVKLNGLLVRQQCNKRTAVARRQANAKSK